MKFEQTQVLLDEHDKTEIEIYRQSQNTAVLCVLFTDVVGSTAAAENIGESAYLGLKEIHDRIVRSVIEKEEAGKIIKEIGDSFFAVFAEPSKAVERAVEIQNQIANHQDDLTVDQFKLTIRVGVHMGQVSVDNRTTIDIFGRHVNRAARVMSLAGPGQVLTTAPVWDNASGWLSRNDQSDIAARMVGKTVLKGIDEKITLYEFFSRDSGGVGTPLTILKNRKRQLFQIGLGSVLVISAILALLFSRENEGITSPAETQKFYLQMDFSGLKNVSNLRVDTAVLKRDIHTQTLIVFQPDSVVTDENLAQIFLEKGEVYRERPLENRAFYVDTMGFSVIMRAWGDLNTRNIPELYFSIYSMKGRSSIVTIPLDDPNIMQRFRSYLTDHVMKLNKPHYTMKVVALRDSNLVIRYNSESGQSLQRGIVASVQRNFSLPANLTEYVEYLERKVAYLESFSNDTVLIRRETVVLNGARNELLHNTSVEKNRVVGDRIGMARITEAYDSTGIAEIISRVPWDSPKVGDGLSID